MSDRHTPASVEQLPPCPICGADVTDEQGFADNFGRGPYRYASCSGCSYQADLKDHKCLRLAGQDRPCSLGVGCDETGMCYADAHGQPEQCGRTTQPPPVSDVRPIPMLLWCPQCHVQHVDEPDERTPDWSNPPHRSHLCHACGCIWRPADVPTEGVAAIETKGKADTFDAQALTAAPGEGYAQGLEAAAKAIDKLAADEDAAIAAMYERAATARASGAVIAAVISAEFRRAAKIIRALATTASQDEKK